MASKENWEVCIDSSSKALASLLNTTEMSDTLELDSESSLPPLLESGAFIFVLQAINLFRS